mmetsp:Transcript_17301/g.51581  ORF Transcript_17301/g.51581 Transcript_17301/m.51581 type:complete len:285 (-) Transcript_17301:342-1196(-)
MLRFDFVDQRLLHHLEGLCAHIHEFILAGCFHSVQLISGGGHSRAQTLEVGIPDGHDVFPSLPVILRIHASQLIVDSVALHAAPKDLVHLLRPYGRACLLRNDQVLGIDDSNAQIDHRVIDSREKILAHALHPPAVRESDDGHTGQGGREPEQLFDTHGAPHHGSARRRFVRGVQVLLVPHGCEPKLRPVGRREGIGRGKERVVPIENDRGLISVGIQRLRTELPTFDFARVETGALAAHLLAALGLQHGHELMDTSKNPCLSVDQRGCYPNRPHIAIAGVTKV